ncbi:unnamed protein product [Timema podura]|uniref:Uncharacterized protein n=1 Tax=Timema podura TaxID=61482 RepID=A0ABN7NRB4_TIMPD|nr:unnamed protein product [Timema podura]
MLEVASLGLKDTSVLGPACNTVPLMNVLLHFLKNVRVRCINFTLSDESAAKIKISTEDTTTALLDVGGGPTINLSTKQSAKIAEISKSIEHQGALVAEVLWSGVFRLGAIGTDPMGRELGVFNGKLSLTRRKPVGGVEAMFSEERTENNTNIANRPIPKPRQQLQLSDWDLEDLEDFASS